MLHVEIHLTQRLEARKTAQPQAHRGQRGRPSDPPLSLEGEPTAPAQAIQKRPEQRGRVFAQPLDDVRVPREELVAAVVVDIAVRSDGQQINDPEKEAEH